MSVQCGNCGEVLLGSVNRCWKCGRPLVAHAGPADVPPVRRAPIAGSLLEASEAQLIDEAVAVAPARRTGSPFASERPTAPADDSRIPDSMKREVKRSGGIVAKIAGALSIALGVIALGVLYFFPLGSLVIAIVGIVFGIIGLNSANRTAAVTGLILCCIALALSAFFSTVLLYEMIYGVSPFAEPTPVMDPAFGP